MLKVKVFCLSVTVMMILEARTAAASDGTSVAELTKKFEQLNQQSKSPTLLPKAKQITQAIQEELKKADTVAVVEETRTDAPPVSEKTEKQPEHAQKAPLQKMPELKELVDLAKPWGLDLQKVASRGLLYRNTPERNKTNVKEVSIEIDNLQMLKDYLKAVPKATKDLKQKLDEDRLKLTDQIRNKLTIMNEDPKGKKRQNKKDTKEVSLLISKLKDNQMEISRQFDKVKSANDAFRNPWYLEAEMNRKEDYILEKLKEFGLTREHLKELPARGTK